MIALDLRPETCTAALDAMARFVIVELGPQPADNTQPEPTGPCDVEDGIR